MCGIAGIFGADRPTAPLRAMVASQRHRGPDMSGTYEDPSGVAGLGHNRLSILDLSPAGQQPMCSDDRRFWIAFNGEVYNYLELRAELGDYPFRSQTDTEVILAAYERWGTACLDRLVGMFAFLLWDAHRQCLFAARDRFGVKPLYYHRQPSGALLLASEIRALHAAGVAVHPEPATWAVYLAYGLHDHCPRTFWQDVEALPPGHFLTWQRGASGQDRTQITRWYDLAERVGCDWDTRPTAEVAEEYLALLEESIRLRFRSDVPVGINLSGGLDSSILLGLVQAVQGHDSDVKAFTFVTGDPRYDELPWVREMLARTHHPSIVACLKPAAVPALAASVQAHQDEPFGGLPTLAYALLFERARAEGIVVLLDGQGMDEQWAGYDYYLAAQNGRPASIVQGTKDQATRPQCLTHEFRSLAEPFEPARPFPDALRNLQYRDTRYTKIPRALRFNDRISMRVSTELREPFLDHRLFELALRQPPERKIQGPSGRATRKWLLRQIGRRLLPDGLVEAPKRSLQTPQREWLREELRDWAHECIENCLGHYGGAWLDPDAVRAEWQAYQQGQSDNSFYLWQWINLGLSRGLPGVQAAQGFRPSEAAGEVWN